MNLNSRYPAATGKFKTLSFHFLSMLFGLVVSACLSPAEGVSTDLPVEITDARDISMRLVPAGEFSMGSDSDDDSRNASHRIYLDAFYMDKFEVTNARYEACVTSGVCNPPQYAKSDFRPSYYGNPEFDNYPVVYVDWTMARTFCEEWTSSLNKSYPFDATDGRQDLTRSGDRVIRGGSWNEDSNDLHVFYRSWIGQNLSESELGFRCARDAGLK